MARVTVVPETIDYPDSDGLPMAESEFQFWPILCAGSALANHYRARDDVYVWGNLLLYYEEENRKASEAPRRATWEPSGLRSWWCRTG